LTFGAPFAGASDHNVKAAVTVMVIMGLIGILLLAGTHV